MDGRFETFLTAKNDLIDNAAYHLACAIAAKESERRCHPFYEGDDRMPCYCGKDCAAADCPLKTGFDISTAQRG